MIESLREGRFDDRRDFSLYVQGVARLTALRALRESRRHATEEGFVSVEALATGKGRSPDERLARQEVLRRVMDLASEECRHLLRAYYLEESSYEEIATSLGIPIGSVKSRLFRCVEAARKSIHVMVRRRENADG